MQDNPKENSGAFSLETIFGKPVRCGNGIYVVCRGRVYRGDRPNSNPAGNFTGFIDQLSKLREYEKDQNSNDEGVFSKSGILRVRADLDIRQECLPGDHILFSPPDNRYGRDALLASGPVLETGYSLS